VNGAREIVGQRRETLGGEWMLLHAFGWRHLLDANVRDRPQRRLRLDAVPPVLPDPSPFGHDADSAIDGRRLQDGGASGPVVRDF
jgi:hypothetical protein